ncbi:MAG: GTPase, partial [bacterium]|nr:GTPase [bacterium]
RGVRDVGILARYRHITTFAAERGQDGERDSRHGKSGKDFTLDVPIGSVMRNLATGRVFEVLAPDQSILILSGGRGGYGNEHFKASTNQTPREHTDGKEGEGADFLIELELIADAGIIGLPNAGKTSFLNALTRASAKVGNYAFTTLEPNLGDFYGFILADIPGLIEGASSGRGLGDKFLRHIKRTRLLIHCIALDSQSIEEDYETVRHELAAFGGELTSKPEIILLSKSDLVLKEVAEGQARLFEQRGKEVILFSSYDEEAIKKAGGLLSARLKADNE